MDPFEWSQATRVVFGAGSLDRLGELVRGLGGQRVFLVTDAGLVRAGHVERAEQVLRDAGCEPRRYAEVPENPTAADVRACRDSLGDWPADALVGFGGGSSIDVAKGCAFLQAGGGVMEDYWGVGKARGTLLPLVAVPTTAGTGTEVQSFALIEQDGSHQKMACGDPQALPKIALLDPALTLSLPPFVTACTGLDAVGHAVETAVSRRATPVSRRFSAEALELLAQGLPRVLRDPSDLDARGRTLLGAAHAGVAIENSMLGAAHSMANPLTARHQVPHGQAVGTALPTVVRFNGEDPAVRAQYAWLTRHAGLCPWDASEDAAFAALLACLDGLLETAGLPRNLAGLGVDGDAVATLAPEAAGQWTAQFNPRAVGEPEFAQLFREACRA